MVDLLKEQVCVNLCSCCRVSSWTCELELDVVCCGLFYADLSAHSVQWQTSRVEIGRPALLAQIRYPLAAFRFGVSSQCLQCTCHSSCCHIHSSSQVFVLLMQELLLQASFFLLKKLMLPMKQCCHLTQFCLFIDQRYLWLLMLVLDSSSVLRLQLQLSQQCQLSILIISDTKSTWFGAGAF